MPGIKQLLAFSQDEREKLAAINLPAHAAGYFTNKVDTYISHSGQFEKVDATFIPLPGGEDFFTWNASLKRWDYTGDTDRELSVFMTFTGGHDNGSTRLVTWKAYKTGAAEPTPPAEHRIESNDPVNITLMVPITIFSPGDYLELFATMNTSSDNVETSNMNFLVR